MFKEKLPKFENTPKSLLKWAGLMFVSAVGTAILQIVLQFVVAVFGLLALIFLVLSVVVWIFRR